jgi:riboflavin biosynthesis pyrimidine reductase
VSSAPGGVPRIEVLLERDPGAAETEAERRYGGRLRLEGGSPHVFANFVSTLDGVVSLGLDDGSDSATISGRHPADRFVMGLLRAAAGAVLIGSGTLAASPGHRWDHRTLVPELAEELDAFRAAAGLAAGPPPLAVVTGSGRLPPHAVLEGQRHVVVVTSEAGAAAVSRFHPELSVALAGSGPVLDGAAVVAAAAEATGAQTVLCEGGPRLAGSLLRGRCLHELFLSISPMLAGRDARDRRPGLVEGVAFPAEALQHAELWSLREAESLLLLRYRLQRQAVTPHGVGEQLVG